jgi:NitT/TauT family transport system substrate-binding protein
MRRLVAAAVAALLAAGCTASPGGPATSPQRSGGGSGSPSTGPASGPGAGVAPKLTVRLGFVPDVTQSTALVGIRDGLFATSLGRQIALRPLPFANSAAETAALAAGKLDVAYVSPDAILADLAMRRARPIIIISGASVAESQLVVNRRITAPSSLDGHVLAVPAPDGAQDIALRSWLGLHHLVVGTRRGIALTAIAPGPALVAAFRSGKIAGAVELPPWNIELSKAGGHILADGAGLSGSSISAAANLVVTRSFFNTNSAAVYDLLRGQVQATDLLRRDPLQSSQAIATALAEAGHPLSSNLLALSMAQISFTDDPRASSLAAQARAAKEEGLAAPATMPAALYDFAPLDLILRAAGEPPVTN